MFLACAIIVARRRSPLSQAYADYNDLMTITEQLISGMVKEITGGYIVKYHPHTEGEEVAEVEIDFTPPFKRIPLIEGIEEAGGFKVPRPLESDETRAFLDETCKRFGVRLLCSSYTRCRGLCVCVLATIRPQVVCGAPRTTTRMLDKLVGHFLESNIIKCACFLCVVNSLLPVLRAPCVRVCCVLCSPTFILNHPEIMSPLSKAHRSIPGVTERFELFINHHEYCNAYTELNNPHTQRDRFLAQASQKKDGDDEAQVCGSFSCYVCVCVLSALVNACHVFGASRVSCGSDSR